GGTKNFRFEEIEKLKPDLIIGNKEENYEAGIRELEKDFPVWMSDIYTLGDAFQMMKELGTICDLEDASMQVANRCKEAINKIKGSKSGRVLYLIWKNPWMAAGKNTFIDHMLSHLGYENVVSEERYPELTENQIHALNPEYIFLSSEPFPFKTDHLKTAQNQWPMAKSMLVDGELYSWYGSRLREWTSFK
ncbi:MAG: helical backbone metal receptor, partial [Bacteroidota bacterium]